MMITIKRILLLSSISFSTILMSGCSETVAKDEKKVEEFAIPVTVAHIERGVISSNFHTTATLESRNEADIITRVTGIIEELTIEEGDYVEKGQVLAKVDARRYQLSLDKAEAELASLKQELQRSLSMLKKKLISAQSLDKLKYQHQAALAARELAALDLQDSQVIASMSGYISQRYVKAGHFTQGYQKLFHIVDPAQLQAVVYLPEHQLSQINIDQTAVLSFSARKNKVFQAKVRSISPVIDSRSGTFKVILTIDNTQKQLMPGMFAQIAITFATHLNALTIPSDAILTLDNQSKIYLIKESKAIEVTIKKGFVEEQLTEIIGKINEGDKVVVSGHHNLKANALVEILNVEVLNTEQMGSEEESSSKEALAIAKAN
jgi:membrane fusion protein (multidrug efflux system)